MNQRLLTSFIGIALLVAIGFFIWSLLFRSSEPQLTKPQASGTQSDTKEASTTDTTTPQLPQQVQLTVPFTAQAPTANWDELHNEACEEASSIMAYAYFNSLDTLPPDFVEREIAKLTNWQTENFGYYLSITTKETARMLTDVYDLKTEISAMDEATIKQALNDNKLVILPANGRMLENPNYKPPGPLYHMLVITGYDEQGFITNDPGTRKGLNYRYSYDTLQAATGTWDHNSHSVNLTDKHIIIVSN